MRFHNNIGLQVCCGRSGWSQSTVATRLELAGFDISRSGISKLEARLRFVDDKDLIFLAEVLSSYRGAFPATRKRRAPIRLYGKLETTRFWMEVAPALAMSHVAGTCDSGFLSKIVHDASVRAASSPTPLVRASAKTRKRASVIGNLQREIHKARGRRLNLN